MCFLRGRIAHIIFRSSSLFWFLPLGVGGGSAMAAQLLWWRQEYRSRAFYCCGLALFRLLCCIFYWTAFRLSTSCNISLINRSFFDEKKNWGKLINYTKFDENSHLYRLHVLYQSPYK